ncbi:MAG TPA: ATP-binding protein [Chloroflexota bacterium]|nr:ATP-binding protein [Chloroflexota bacterium]
MDGTIGSRSGITSAHRTKIEAVIASAERLLLYGGTLAEPPGQAYLGLLRALISASEAGAIRRAAAMLFTALAEAAADGLPGPGDAWQRYLIQRVLLDENPFSRAARRWRYEEIPAGLREAARRDLVMIGRLFALNGERLGTLVADILGEVPGWTSFDALGPDRPHHPLAVRFASRTDLAEWADLLPELAAYYREHGVGIFARYRAFRWSRRPEGAGLIPIRRPDPVTFDDLIGYAEQRAVVRRNTERFLRGLPANNLLLYGDRGTGKSSTVKALLNAYGGQGLRLIEVQKSALGDFPTIVEMLADRPERFILFVDDLSFEEGEAGYAELKALLEGGLEVRPENVLLYATSNRRHLVPERFSDRAEPGGDVHAGDTFQEKLSLADRFGITVIFTTPDQEQYLQIVEGLVRRRGLEVDRDRLRQQALQWAAWNNGRSGRTARQFVDDLTAALAMP